jgi:phosphoribosylformylglycinamidine cyclo-ligase
MEGIVEGMVVACKENSCSLVGGETAEMPGFYRQGEYDIAGMIVGIVEKANIYDGKKVKEGDQLIALPSTGLHTNGYSLARSVLFDRFEIDDFVDELKMPIGEALLAVHRSYLTAIQSLITIPEVHAFAHITGGGIVGNTSRVIPKGLSLEPAFPVRAHQVDRRRPGRGHAAHVESRGRAGYHRRKRRG